MQNGVHKAHGDTTKCYYYCWETDILNTFHPHILSLSHRLNVEQIFYLEGFLNTGGQHRFYITRPDLMSMTWIANHIQTEEQRDSRNYYIIFVPRKLETCDYLLEEEGVYGYVKMFEWDLHLIPLDAHLLSLERFDSFRNLYVQDDFTVLHSVAKSLLTIERLYGSIPTVYWKGEYAKMAWELYTQLKGSLKVPQTASAGCISEVILLDRRIDLVTPLCRQLTYEGILDDVLRIKSGYVLISKDITCKKQDSKVLMNSKDPVFSVIRSLHFSAVPQTLSAITKGLKAAYSEGKSLSSIPELKSFVQKLPDLVKKHDSLSIHVKVSEHITEKMKRQEFSRLLLYERAILEAVEKTHVTDFIEECIQRQMYYQIPLELLCLMSTTNNGIRPKYLQSLKKGFLHSYGHKHLVTFRNLYKIGLLHDKDEDPVKGAKSAFKQLTKVLKLVPKDPGSYDVYSPKDMSYVYGGSYKPLSCAVVEYLVKNRSWKGLEDAVKGWNGPVYPVDRSPPPPPPKDRVILVYFIGGVTFSEVNALQELGRRTSTTYIVATTNTLSPGTLIDNSLADEIM